MFNLTAYNSDGIKLFTRNCHNKDEAKKEITNNPWLFRVEYVVFKSKRHSIREVYLW